VIGIRSCICGGRSGRTAIHRSRHARQFALDVESLGEPSHYLVRFFVDNFHFQRLESLLSRLQRLDGLHKDIIELEVGNDRGLSRRDVLDGCRLVPDDVLLAENVHEHHHVNRIAHAVEGATELRTDDVAIVPRQCHLGGCRSVIISEMGDLDPRSDVRRIPIHDEADQPCLVWEFDETRHVASAAEIIGWLIDWLY